MENKTQLFESLLKNELMNSPEKQKHDILNLSRFDSLSLNDSLVHKQEESGSPFQQVKTNADDHELSLEQSKFLKFNPPLYLQRYDYVSDLLKQYQCRTFMDIGAAECKMLRYLKNTSTNLNLIIGVDIDEQILANTKDKFAISWFDYIQPKDQPIEVYLVKGDIAQPSCYFLNQISSISLDFISLVEIIEHLHPDVLANCIKTVFNHLKPKCVLITTPNSEFNVLFENENPNKFRHWDHKFEWTRYEFQTWCQSDILDKYPDYELVFYDGIGAPPDNCKQVGHCTQTALFRLKQFNESFLYHDYVTQLKRANYINRQNNQDEQKINIPSYLDTDSFDNNYKLVSFTRYPFESFDFETIEQRNQAIINELNYLIHFLSKPSGNRSISEQLTDEQKEKLENNIDLEDDKIRIASLEKLFSFSNIVKFKLSDEDLINLMQQEGFQFTNSGRYVYENSNDGEDYYSESDTSFHKHHDDKEEDEDRHAEQINEDWEDKPNQAFEEEDWDVDMANTSVKNEALDMSLNTSLQPKIVTPREQFEDVVDDSDINISIDENNNSKYGKITNESPNNILNISSQKTSIDDDLDTLNFEINYRASQSRELALKFRALRRKYYKEFKKKTFDLKIIPSQFELS